MITLLMAAAILVPVCEPDEQRIKVCDVLDRCWIECRPINPDASTDPLRAGTPDAPATVPGLGNPGNGRAVGNAGEKGMDNEPDKRGTRGNAGKGGKK